MKKITLVSLLMSTMSFANLRAHPTRLILSDKVKTASFGLTNQSNETKKYSVKTVFFDMDNDGNMQIVPLQKAMARPESAAELLKFSPRQFTIKPGENQVIRVRAVVNRPLKDGVYRAHIHVVPDSTQSVVAKDPQKKGKLSAEISIQLAVAVATYFKHGDIQNKVDLSSLSVVKDKTGLEMAELLLNQSGNGIAYGDFFVFGKVSETSEPVLMGSILGIAAYNKTRKVRIPLDLDQAQRAKFTKVWVEFKKPEDEGSELIAKLDKAGTL